MSISLGIIGTAGRKEDKQKLTKDYYNLMIAVAKTLVSKLEENNYKITHLISGGAAYADHVAVNLYLNDVVPNLILFIPAEFENSKFNEQKIEGVKFNTGNTLNYYHKTFSINSNVRSLQEIQKAKEKGAQLLVCKGGFYGRNAMVAKESDVLLAMTFGNKEYVKDGGTADTVKRYLSKVDKEGIFDKSFHFDLNENKIYKGCKVNLY